MILVCEVSNTIRNKIAKNFRIIKNSDCQIKLSSGRIHFKDSFVYYKIDNNSNKLKAKFFDILERRGYILLFKLKKDWF